MPGRRVGTKEEVWRGEADRTGGGLSKADLTMSTDGRRVVSRAVQASAFRNLSSASAGGRRATPAPRRANGGPGSFSLEALLAQAPPAPKVHFLGDPEENAGGGPDIRVVRHRDGSVTRVGNKDQVWAGTADATAGGVRKKGLARSADGRRIVFRALQVVASTGESHLAAFMIPGKPKPRKKRTVTLHQATVKDQLLDAAIQGLGAYKKSQLDAAGGDGAAPAYAAAPAQAYAAAAAAAPAAVAAYGPVAAGLAPTQAQLAAVESAVQSLRQHHRRRALAVGRRRR